MIPKEFLIAGCQRSGTTLLRLVLESHGSIISIDEPTSYELLSDSKKLDEIKKNSEGHRWIGFKIPRFTEQLNQSSIFDYGTPFVTKPIPNFYQNFPIIFIIRDVRDVVCSMINLKENGISWMTHWGIPIIKYWIENSPTFRKRFESDISKIKESNFSDIISGSFYWKYKNTSCLEYEKLGFPIKMIKYEDLVRDPKPILESIIKFLDLMWEDSILQHHLFSHTQIQEDGFAIGKTDPKRPIDSFHVGRYKSELTEEQEFKVASISEDLMTSLGYSM